MAFCSWARLVAENRDGGWLANYSYCTDDFASILVAGSAGYGGPSAGARGWRFELTLADDLGF